MLDKNSSESVLLLNKSNEKKPDHMDIYIYIIKLFLILLKEFSKIYLFYFINMVGSAKCIITLNSIEY